MDADVMPEPYKSPVSLEDKVSMIEDAEDATYQARQTGDMCRRYYHGKQLTREERDELRKRGQPVVIDNVIRRKIKFLKGWERQTRTDVKAYPRNAPDDEDAAEAATDALRFQEQAGHLDQLCSAVWDEMIIGGFGGLEILGPNPKDKRIIECKLWRWDRLGYDPYSVEPDFSDARYLYGVVWMDLTEAKRRWPDKGMVFDRTVTSEVTRSGNTYDDKPKLNAWATRGKRERVKVIQMYYLAPGPDGQDQWHWCLFTKGGELEGGIIELLNEFSEPDCPLVMQSAYVDEENNRYGEVVEMLTMQDAINKRESKITHLLNSNQTVGEAGSILEPDKFKAEMARPDGHGTLQPGALSEGRFQFRDNSKEIQGYMAIQESARARMDLMGANATLQGKHEGVASGKAIRASQEGGLIELTDLKDMHTQFKRNVYAKLWNRIRQYWDEEVWVRVTDNEETVRFVGFNRQVTGYEDMMDQAVKEGIPEEQAQEQIRQAIEMNPSLRFELEQVVRTENVPAEIDVDIIIDVTTESVNIQEETFSAMSNMFAPGQLPPEVILELAPIAPKKRRQIKEMLAPKPEQVEQQQMADGMQADNLAADTEGKRAKAMRDTVEAQVKAATPIVPKQLPISRQDQAFLN
jgi:hypothetical protein